MHSSFSVNGHQFINIPQQRYVIDVGLDLQWKITKGIVSNAGAFSISAVEYAMGPPAYSLDRW